MPFFLCMALTGFSNMFVNINASKITASWFEQEKLGILMGIFAFCGQLPGAFATATTAVLFDSRTSAFIVSAIFCISVFVLWLFFVKDKPEDTMEEREKIDQENQPSIGDSLKVVLSNKGIWLVSICIMMALGSTVTLSTFMPMALQTMYGIDLKVCGTIASMLTLGNCIGSITGPIVFSKIKNVKVFVSGAAVLSFAGIIMCWRFPSIFVLHILVLYTGIMLGASMPIFLSAPVLLEGIGTKYAGSAAGVISTLQLLGAVLIPTYILTPIAGDNYSLLFMLASICMVIMFLCGLLLPQFGNNQK
nr:MFS transporter [Blautia sp.]